MAVIAVPKRLAQEVRGFCIREGLLDRGYRVRSTQDAVLLAVTDAASVRRRFPEVKASRIRLERLPRRTSFKERVAATLSPAERRVLKTAYDVVGDIAILEVPDRLVPRERGIAEALLAEQRTIATVLRKGGAHEGPCRVQRMVHLAGERKTLALHREHGVRIWADVAEVYFSPRLSTERKRIYTQVKPGERILNMFCGVGPYDCVIAKNTAAAEIVSNDINPAAIRLLMKNIAENRITNITPHCGDARDYVPRLGRTFDRIIMPLPKDAEDFLGVAFAASRKGTVIHLYMFLPEDEIMTAGAARIREEAERAGVSCSMRRVARCGQQSPRTYRVCYDLVVG
ncbi:class I SAM-dependent methyltransferase family protein [Candidatus Woesearchaeota archaeon]|nr:class I SAM-dependent methyltransferase family protein [Candidatus Woesearchaeota archaeon]